MSTRDIVCLSHLPWAFGLERPHQVMRRFARDRHVFFVEEPIAAGTETRTVMRTVEPNVHVVTLHVPSGTRPHALETAQRRCLAAVATDTERPLLWVYSPPAFRAAHDLAPSLLVYDCVTDHEARRASSREARAAELELLADADVMFTAGTALFDAKRAPDISTYPLPSSVEPEHFASPPAKAPRDATKPRGPRVGFLGVIDDRLDLELVDRIAAARPHVRFVMLGGLVGLTKDDLPRRLNIQWLGAKPYAELPNHVAAWDAAFVPFRSDAATRRSEPSGLLACIAAGKPVLSTPLDEVAAYGARGVVRIVPAERFVAGIDAALRDAGDPARMAARHAAREALLARTSWDRTVQAMKRLVAEAEMARGLAEGSVSLPGASRAMVPGQERSPRNTHDRLARREAPEEREP